MSAPEPTAGEQVHWIGEHHNTLHGNGAGSKDMEHTSGDEDEVTCRLCLSLLAREDVRERIVHATLVEHPQPGKVWVQVPHRNDIGSDWIEADARPATPDADDASTEASVADTEELTSHVLDALHAAHHRPGNITMLDLAESVAEVLASDWLSAREAKARADERERIAQAIEALPEHDGAGWPNHAYEIKADAARIARSDA